MSMLRPIFSILAIGAASFTAPAALSAQIPVTEVQEFLGNWEAEMQAAQGGTFEFDLFLRDQDGNLAGEVTGPQGDTDAIEQFALIGEELILAYSVDFGGQRSDIRVTLSPNAAGLGVILEMPGFSADGVATRMEEEPAQ